MSYGTVKWFNPQKRYGFIQREGGGQELIVHLSAVQSAGIVELRPGQRVTFDIVTYWKTGKPTVANLKTIC
jgi:cold shock protein